MKAPLKILLTATLLAGSLTLTAFAEEADLPVDIAPAPTIAEPLIAPAPTSLPFTDVDESTLFQNAIQYVYEDGVMIGTSDTQFSPTSPLTRAMLVTILYRFEGEPAFMNDLVFDDVVRDSYYEKAVVWAEGKGIVNGVSETQFAPDQNITREQLAAILYRYAEYKAIDLETAAADTNTLSFDDVFDSSDYAKTPIHYCLANEILLPRTDTTIQPKADATRAEAAQGIYGLALLSTNDDPTSFDYKDLAGDYQDSYSGRASLTATEADGGLQIVVDWSDSAFSFVRWTMTASYNEEGLLVYEDGKKEAISTDENGNVTTETLYENQAGYFSPLDGVLLWDGAYDESCRECVFEMFPDAE